MSYHKTDHACANCGAPRPVFRHRGRVKRCPQHDLCPKCFRAVENRDRRKENR